MPMCMVVSCKNISAKVNFKNQGITFHLFPSDPSVKKKWIDACGRGPNWSPGKNSTICSKHFDETCFQPIKRRRLFIWAVPTLKLGLIVPSVTEISIKTEPEHVETSKTSLQDCSKTSLRHRSKTLQVCPKATSEHSSTKTELGIEEVSQKTKLLTLLKQRNNMINQQKKEIRMLRQRASRYKRKVEELTEILNDMQDNSLLICNQVKKHRNEVEDITIQNVYSR